MCHPTSNDYLFMEQKHDKKHRFISVYKLIKLVFGGYWSEKILNYICDNELQI